MVLLAVAGVIAFCAYRSRRNERKERESEQQAALVEEFVSANRNASRNASRGPSLDFERGRQAAEIGEQGVGVTERGRSTTYLAGGEERSRSSSVPLRLSRLSIATAAEEERPVTPEMRV
jgi:hypothetical protein